MSLDSWGLNQGKLCMRRGVLWFIISQMIAVYLMGSNPWFTAGHRAKRVCACSPRLINCCLRNLLSEDCSQGLQLWYRWPPEGEVWLYLCNPSQLMRGLGLKPLRPRMKQLPDKARTRTGVFVLAEHSGQRVVQEMPLKGNFKEQSSPFYLQPRKFWWQSRKWLQGRVLIFLELRLRWSLAHDRSQADSLIKSEWKPRWAWGRGAGKGFHKYLQQKSPGIGLWCAITELMLGEGSLVICWRVWRDSCGFLSGV